MKYKDILINYVETNKRPSQLYIRPESSFRNSTIISLPTFYVKKKQTPLAKLLRKVAKDHYSNEMNEKVLSNDDLDLVLKLLTDKSKKDGNGSEKINYEGYCNVSKSLPEKFQRYFKPSVFMMFKHDDEGRIEVQALFSFILRFASIQQERVCISTYDTDDDGFLFEEELEKYLGELVPTFPQLDQMESTYLPFYLCGACRKFFFFLDLKKVGKVSLKDILMSPILSEFFELQQPELESSMLMSNWFSLYSSTKVYRQYVDLDTDRNGMLSDSELSQFAKGRYNKFVISRVFQEYQTFSNEIDYKNYLDFVLAVNDFNNSRSITYFFKLLDIQAQGFLDEFTLSFVVKDLAERLEGPLFQLDDFLNEVFDMANTKDKRIITLKDLHGCGVGGIIVSLLVDLNALIANQTKD